jgi:TolB protein
LSYPVNDVPGEPVGDPNPISPRIPLRRVVSWFSGRLPADLPEKLAGFLPHGPISFNFRSLSIVLAILLIGSLVALRVILLRPATSARATATPLITRQALAVLPVSQTPLTDPTAAQVATASPTAAPAPPPSLAAAVQPAVYPSALNLGLLALSLSEDTYAHLFAYQPQSQPLTRLTGSPWDDITPALSPDGSRIAFASRQNGYWDLFLLSLVDGSLQRLTDTGDADTSPTWSPDGKWLAYETYSLNHAQIAVLSVEDPSAAPMFLTSDENENHMPAWSPQGRKIAFISTRPEGDSLWVADLDAVEGRFTRITQATDGRLLHPAWAPDGVHLGWGQFRDGQSTLMTWDASAPDTLPIPLGSGDWPAWSPSGDLLAARITTPDQDFLAIYAVPTGKLVLPPQPLPARLLGLDWKNSVYPATRAPALEKVANQPPAPIWQDQAAVITVGQNTRYGLVPLDGISAPNASLSDQVDESFRALRSRLASELGWDFLSSLENAYLPITSPLPPESDGDWLFTGRAIAVNPAPLPAGWMAVAREDFGGQTYWRIFLKTRFQDGSQGQPLAQLPWDISARYGSDPRLYEQGGAPTKSIPSGYWVDFTEFASRFGWQRLPAAPDWRAFYPGMRFNQFARTDGLNWTAAMLELYPPEALVTSVPNPAPGTNGSPAKTPTPAAQPSLTPTRRPTWTPLPG